VAKRWWRLGQALAGAVVVLFVLRYLSRNWDEVQSATLDWDIGPGWIAASVALVLLTYALQVESWRRMLAGWGPRIAWWPAARIWILSSMGKYIPGKIWAIAGMAMLSQRQGVPPWAATGSAVLLQVVSLATGGLAVAFAGMGPLEARHPGSSAAVVILIGLSAAGLAVVLSPQIAGRLVRRFAPESEGATPPATTVGFGIAANVLAWILYGTALWLLARGVLPTAGIGLREAIGGFAASYIAGYLFLLAPGGLGVRESVFVIMFEPRMGLAAALALAGASRLALTAADILAVLPFLRRTGEAAEHAV
jgi:hypothetical protein